jgi:hypothetical protein
MSTHPLQKQQKQWQFTERDTSPPKWKFSERDTSRASSPGVELAKHTISAAAAAGAYVSTTPTGQGIMAAALVSHGALAHLSPDNVDDIVQVGKHVAYTATTAIVALVTVAVVVALFVAYIWIRPRWCSMHAVCRAINDPVYASLPDSLLGEIADSSDSDVRIVGEFPRPTVLLLEPPHCNAYHEDEDEDDEVNESTADLVANYDKSGLRHWIDVQFPDSDEKSDVAKMSKPELARLCSTLGMTVDLVEYPKRW